MTDSALAAESSSHSHRDRRAAGALSRLRRWPARGRAGDRPRRRGTVVLLHGGGPGASSWSNFGQNMPVDRQAVPHGDDGPARLRPDCRPAGRPGIFSPSTAQALAGLLDELGIAQGAPHRQLPRRRRVAAVRAELPGPGRPAGADGTRRTDAQRAGARSHRGRPAADGVRRAAGAEPGEDGGLPPDHGARPAAHHRRADRRAVSRPPASPRRWPR